MTKKIKVALCYWGVLVKVNPKVPAVLGLYMVCHFTTLFVKCTTVRGVSVVLLISRNAICIHRILQILPTMACLACFEI